MLEKLKKLIEEAQKQAQKAYQKPDIDHPLAAQTDWFPLKGGGSNFQTHRLDHSNADLLVFKASKGAYWFGGVFAFFGVLGMVIPLAIFVSEGMKDWFMVLFAVLFGGIFLSVGLGLLYFMTIPRVFDTFYGCYYRGRKKPDHLMGASRDGEQPLTQLSEVKAIQVIPERIRSKNGSYHSYEINLVLRDARRINVIDHGKYEAVIGDAEILANQLGVPLWDAS